MLTGEWTDGRIDIQTFYGHIEKLTIRWTKLKYRIKKNGLSSTIRLYVPTKTINA